MLAIVPDWGLPIWAWSVIAYAGFAACLITPGLALIWILGKEQASK